MKCVNCSWAGREPQGPVVSVVLLKETPPRASHLCEGCRKAKPAGDIQEMTPEELIVWRIMDR